MLIGHAGAYNQTALINVVRLAALALSWQSHHNAESRNMRLSSH